MPADSQVSNQTETDFAGRRDISVKIQKKFFLRRKRDYEYAYSCGNGSRSPW